MTLELSELLVEPQYGFGWTSKAGEPVKVPERFPLLAERLAPGLLIGSVEADGHPLSGQWVALVQRTKGENPTYNLYVFPDRPGDVAAAVRSSGQTANLTGFAVLAS